MRNPPQHALCGYDGRVVYTDHITASVYALLTEEKRAQVRGMIEGFYQGSVKLERNSVAGLEIMGGEFRISDCVVRCSLEFLGEPDNPKLVIKHREVLIDGAMPETLVNGLKGRDLGDLIDLNLLRGTKIVRIEEDQEFTRIVFDDDTSYIIDNQGTPPENRKETA